jgi:hypothetical protein
LHERRAGGARLSAGLAGNGLVNALRAGIGIPAAPPAAQHAIVSSVPTYCFIVLIVSLAAAFLRGWTAWPHAGGPMPARSR